MDATLLLADIPSSSRDALERFFRQCGFDVVTASDASKCSIGLQSLKPDVLVLGLDLPPGETIEILALLHGGQSWPKTPLVLAVGTAAPDVISRATGVPKESCFQKPVPRERLLDRVGLMVAVMDMHRRGQPRRKLRRPDNRHEKRREVCLV